jgi:hypothetical protein
MPTPLKNVTGIREAIEKLDEYNSYRVNGRLGMTCELKKLGLMEGLGNYDTQPGDMRALIQDEHVYKLVEVSFIDMLPKFPDGSHLVGRDTIPVYDYGDALTPEQK